MTRLALCPIASPGLACNFGGSTITGAIVPGGMDVTLSNRLGVAAGPDTCALPLGVVVWDHRPGNTPDEITVTPAPGYVAIPPGVVIEEGDTAVVQIREWSGM